MARIFGEAGKYDELAALVQRETSGEVVAIAVLGGSKGHGFSVAVRDRSTGHAIAAMPAILRMMADMIDAGAAPSGMSAEPEAPGRPD